MKDFEICVMCYIMVYEQMYNFFCGFCWDVYLMVIMVGVVGVMLVFYYDLIDILDFEQCEIVLICLIVKLLMIVVMVYKYLIGQFFVYLCNDLSYVVNFLYMCFLVLVEQYCVEFVLVKVMDWIMMLYVDYEQNVLILIVCLVGLLGVNLFVCIVVGIVCLWGLVYGGVNQVCLEMLCEIGFVDCILEYIVCVKDKDDLFCLMGFGYCVYKNFDLCVKVMKELVDEVLELLGVQDNLILQVVKELEKIVLEDDYFVLKKFYFNVDFYLGIILEVMGFLILMFMLIFVLLCIVGWILQWKEMIGDLQNKIGCLCQLYVGVLCCDYIEMLKC